MKINTRQLQLGMMLIAWLAVQQAIAGDFADTDPYGALRQRISLYIENHPDINLSLSVIHGDQVVWAEGYSGVNRRSRPATNKTIYRAGSMAKLMTALGVMQLEARGDIDIDQPVSSYLPRFMIKRRFSNAQPITSRQVMTHHAGLPTNIAKGQWTDAHFSTLIEQLRHEYLTYPPDFVMSYSNVGYSILGAMIEDVANQSYESFIDELLFEKLGMTSSGFDDALLQMPGFSSARRNSEKVRLLPIRDKPAMGLYTSASDMGKFLMVLVNNGSYEDERIIDSSLLEEMYEQQNKDVLLDYSVQTGLGFSLNHCDIENAGPVIEHGGTTMYYSSHLMALPEYNLGAIVLSDSREAKNFVHGLTRDIVRLTLEKYYPDRKTFPLKNKDTIYISQKNPLKPISGKYLTRSGLITFKVDEDNVCACDDQKRLDLAPEPDGWYSIVNQKTGPGQPPVKFLSQEVEGQDILVIRKGDTERRLGEYVSQSKISPQWRKRLGDYEVVNPDEDFPLTQVCLVENEQILYLSFRMPRLSRSRIDIPLTTLDQGQAITTGLGRSRGETVVAKYTDEGELLLYSGYLLRRQNPEVVD